MEREAPVDVIVGLQKRESIARSRPLEEGRAAADGSGSSSRPSTAAAASV
jgi:hypothetical protein